MRNLLLALKTRYASLIGVAAAAFLFANSLTSVYAADGDATVAQVRPHSSVFTSGAKVTAARDLVTAAPTQLNSSTLTVGNAVEPMHSTPALGCTNRFQGFCRDLSAAEFDLKSMKTLLPEIAGLTPQRLSLRRNRVSVTYTFR